jgi:4-hydroxy-2-oxoglutarate aldolase
VADWEGVFVAVPTPFRGDEVALTPLASNLRRWNSTAARGYVVLGTTGEFPMLSEAERDQVLAASREAIPREKLLVAGTGADSTLHTIRQTKRAAAMGAEAALIITPHSFIRAFSHASAQVRHYTAVAEASPIPILIDNAPRNTGINLDAETVARIAAHPNVGGIKESSGNIAQCAQIIDQTPKSFDVLVGTAAALLPALAIGASGGMLGLAAIAAREWADVYACARSGRWAEGREIAARLMPADRGIAGRHGIGGLKAALDLQGFYGGPCRGPLVTPDGDAIEDIKELLATTGLL